MAYLEEYHARVADNIEQIHNHRLIVVNHEPQKHCCTSEYDQQLRHNVIQSSDISAESFPIGHNVLAVWNGREDFE